MFDNPPFGFPLLNCPFSKGTKARARSQGVKQADADGFFAFGWTP